MLFVKLFGQSDNEYSRWEVKRVISSPWWDEVQSNTFLDITDEQEIVDLVAEIRPWNKQLWQGVVMFENTKGERVRFLVQMNPAAYKFVQEREWRDTGFKPSYGRRHGNNPWVTEAMFGETATGFRERGVYFAEYQWADEREWEPCPNGHIAYYKSSVGAHICPDCGMLYTGGNWIK